LGHKDFIIVADKHRFPYPHTAIDETFSFTFMVYHRQWRLRKHFNHTFRFLIFKLHFNKTRSPGEDVRLSSYQRIYLHPDE